MILAVAFLAYTLPSGSLKVDGGGVKKDQVKAGEKVTPIRKDAFFDKIFGAPGRKRRGICLVFCPLTKKRHGTVKVMKGKRLHAIYLVVSVPFFT
jgi:hypothetical protein